ncbi:AMP-binding protein [Streptomyces fildesensis]|uniref:AMP-binding protein n=1 Tax=Streptomyces fildesensis TaxID=375757 RepID=A0ABW8BYK9_9ACTN
MTVTTVDTVSDHTDRAAATRRLLHELLDTTAALRPQNIAVRDSRDAWTWENLVQQSHTIAGWLREQGVGPGDRIVVRLPNVREMVALLYAASRVGAALVPISAEMKEFHLKAVIANCEPRVVVVVDGLAEGVQALTEVPVHEVGAVWAAATGTEVRVTSEATSVDSPAVLIYTSGSTATPKGIVCPHAQMSFAADAINQVLGYRADDVVFCRVPLSFDYGLFQVLLTCLSGAELVLADGEADPKLHILIRETGATILPLVPSLGGPLIRLAERDPRPTKLRMFTSTGAALEQRIIDGLWRCFPDARVVRMYGISECKRITVMPPDEDRTRPGSSGRPLPGTQVTILDEEGNEVPAGGSGEITVTGPNVMAGYWRLPEITARTFRTDPETGVTRLHTGDYGSLDADGYLYFEGRRDDMFKRKGMRVSTIEIEAAAMDIPGVRNAAALKPTADRDLLLFVAADLPPQTVLRELAQRLEAVKVPSLCKVIDDFPLTANGKNAKQQLEALLVAEELAAG